MTAHQSTDARQFAAVKGGRSGFSPGGRTAALWVAATGGFLLVVAAGLFIAVRWHDIPDVAKLAVVCALTGAFLVAGQTIRRTLPATGSVLYHLGAFMIPIDLAGLNLRIGLHWREMLLAEGIVCALAFAALARGASSIVLERAAAVAVVVACAGIGAVTVVPAPLVLAGVAAVWVLFRPRSNFSIAWALGAGFAPVITLALQGTTGLSSGIASLGLSTAHDALPAFATGLLAAGVLGAEAQRRREHVLAFLALGAFASSTGVAFVAAHTTRTLDVLALPAAFVAIQIVALLVRRDPFWGLPSRVVAMLSEFPAGAFLVTAVLGLLATPFLRTGERPMHRFAGAAGLLALGWAASGLRRDRFGLPFVASALCGVFAVELATASGPLTGVAMAAAGILCVLAGRTSLDALAISFAVYAPLASHNEPVWALGLGVGTAGALALATFRGTRERRTALAVAALATLGIGAIIGAQRIGDGAAGAIFVIGCWEIGLLLDRSDAVLGRMARFASMAVLLFAASMTPGDRLFTVVPLVAILAVEAVRLRVPDLGHAAALPLQLLVFDVARVAHVSEPYTGVVMCVAAVVWAGLSAVADETFRPPLWTATVLGALFGLGLAAGDPQAFGAALVVCGGLTLGGGLVSRHEWVVHAGAMMITTGGWIELAQADVRASEAYVAPVAAHLIAAGVRIRQSRDASTWLAYGPAIAMLGGAAIAERMGGGGGWHAVVAGGVAAGAVVAGGWRRLAGPLFTGTAILVVVTVYESLGVVATVPTWAWLALGGSALLAAGVAMERNDTTPLEVGRRVVDVVATRFE